jgi:hypothetical protein
LDILLLSFSFSFIFLSFFSFFSILFPFSDNLFLAPYSSYFSLTVLDYFSFFPFNLFNLFCLSICLQFSYFSYFCFSNLFVSFSECFLLFWVVEECCKIKILCEQK